MKLFRFRKGGVHPASCKGYSRDDAVADLTPSKELRLLLRQNIGAPSRAVVKPGDHVDRGGIVAEAGGFVGAPVHSPVSGTVRKIEKVRDISGYWADAVIIERDEEAELPPFYIDVDDARFEEVLSSTAPEEIIRITGEAGIVGLGGASFPTRVKLTIPEGKRIDTLVINGAECEPYLTCDDRLMRERPDDIIRGALLMAKACRPQRIIIGIEANKPEAIEAMRRSAARLADVASSIDRTIEVAALRTRYPQGSEKQLIQAVTGRVVPTGALPADVNCVVDNVATAFALFQSVVCGEPLTRRIVTVTGEGLLRPGNYVACNGMSYNDLIAMAGGLPEDCGKVISGGPMMGKAIANLDAPLTKASGGIVVLSSDESHRRAERPCIRCARCVSACPMGLEPYLLMTLSKLHLQQESEDHGVMNCLECGCCSYICPSHRPLLDSIRLSKTIIRKNQKK